MTETPTDIIAWLERLSNAGFGVLLGLILFGNFMGIWVWGKLYKERVTQLEDVNKKLEAEKNEWKVMALGLLNPLETTLNKGKRG